MELKFLEGRDLGLIKLLTERLSTKCDVFRRRRCACFDQGQHVISCRVGRGGGRGNDDIFTSRISTRSRHSRLALVGNTGRVCKALRQ